MSGFLGLSSLPPRGRQFAHPVDRPLSQFRQGIQEVISKLDIQASARLYDRSDSCNLRPSFRAADVQPVLATQCQWPNASLAPVIVTLQLAVRQVFLKPAPLPQGIVASLGQLASRSDLLADLSQAGLEGRHNRHA